MSESKRSTLWTADGRRIGEIVGQDAGESEFILRILTNARGKALIQDALLYGRGLVVRGPDRPPRDRREADG